MYKALDGEKAQMALDLLFDVDPEKLLVPEYIKQGLEWLENVLDKMSLEFTWIPDISVQESLGENIGE